MIYDTHKIPATLGIKLADPSVFIGNGTSSLDTTLILYFILASLTFFLKI